MIRKLRGQEPSAINPAESIFISMQHHLKPYQLRIYVNIEATKEDMIYKALKVDSERENRYCKKINKDF